MTAPNAEAMMPPRSLGFGIWFDMVFFFWYRFLDRDGTVGIELSKTVENCSRSAVAAGLTFGKQRVRLQIEGFSGGQISNSIMYFAAAVCRKITDCVVCHSIQRWAVC